MQAQSLNHAISLYRESDRVKNLKIEYILCEDEREKYVIKIALLKMGCKVE